MTVLKKHPTNRTKQSPQLLTPFLLHLEFQVRFSTCRTRQQPCLRARHLVLHKAQAAFWCARRGLGPSYQGNEPGLFCNYQPVTLASWFEQVKHSIRVQCYLRDTLAFLTFRCGFAVAIATCCRRIQCAYSRQGSFRSVQDVTNKACTHSHPHIH